MVWEGPWMSLLRTTNYQMQVCISMCGERNSEGFNNGSGIIRAKKTKTKKHLLCTDITTLSEKYLLSKSQPWTNTQRENGGKNQINSIKTVCLCKIGTLYYHCSSAYVILKRQLNVRKVISIVENTFLQPSFVSTHNYKLVTAISLGPGLLSPLVLKCLQSLHSTWHLFLKGVGMGEKKVCIILYHIEKLCLRILIITKLC